MATVPTAAPIPAPTKQGLSLAMSLPLLVAVVRGAGLGRGWLVAMKEQSGKGPWLLSPAVAAIDVYM